MYGERWLPDYVEPWRWVVTEEPARGLLVISNPLATPAVSGGCIRKRWNSEWHLNPKLP